MMRKAVLVGAIAALTASGAVTLPAQSARANGAPAPAVNGEQIFRQRCQACHTAVAGQPARIGPNLSGVVGRKAASTGFAMYSPALKKSGLTWTRQQLDAYIAAPTRLVPGTRMAVVLSDPAQRRAVVDYLARTR